jgi:hypothetical protein
MEKGETRLAELDSKIDGYLEILNKISVSQINKTDFLRMFREIDGMLRLQKTLYFTHREEKEKTTIPIIFKEISMKERWKNNKNLEDPFPFGVLKLKYLFLSIFSGFFLPKALMENMITRFPILFLIQFAFYMYFEWEDHGHNIYRVKKNTNKEEFDTALDVDFVMNSWKDFTSKASDLNLNLYQIQKDIVEYLELSGERLSLFEAARRLDS